MKVDAIQKYVDEKHFGMNLTANQNKGARTGFYISGNIGYTVYLTDKEGTGCIEERLLDVLEDVKKLADYDIARIKGELPV